MNCQETRELIEDALDKRLAGGVKRKFDLHLTHCRDCRRFYEAEQAEHARWFRAMNDTAAEPPHSLPPDFADRLVATVLAKGAAHTPFFHRFRLPRWLKRVACLALLLSGVAFAATVVVEIIPPWRSAPLPLSQGESELLIQESSPNVTAQDSNDVAVQDPNDVAVQDYNSPSKIEGVAARPGEYESSSADQQPSSNNQLENDEGENDMNIKQKTVAALKAAATYCVALVSAANADVYTWTGSASGVWNKTDANWDKGVWVDGNIAVFPSGVSVKDITLGADVTASGVKIASGDWSLGGAHTLKLQVSGSGNVTVSQTSSASLTLKNGVTMLAASPCENNINLLNIENATFATSSSVRFHNGWNGGSELAGGATINVRDGGTLSVYEFVPSPSQTAANAGIYRINVATGGVFQLDHVLQTYNIDTTRYSTDRKSVV